MRWIIEHIEPLNFYCKKLVYDSKNKKFSTRTSNSSSEMLIYFKLKCEYKDSKKGSKYQGYYLSDRDVLKCKSIMEFENLLKSFLYVAANDFIQTMPVPENKGDKTDSEFFGSLDSISEMMYHQKEMIFIKIFSRVKLEKSIQNIEKDIRVKPFKPKLKGLSETKSLKPKTKLPSLILSTNPEEHPKMIPRLSIHKRN